MPILFLGKGGDELSGNFCLDDIVPVIIFCKSGKLFDDSHIYASPVPTSTSKSFISFLGALFGYNPQNYIQIRYEPESCA
jgi:hypothetical protein